MRQRGFTLIEVLVALTIMAGVTTTVLGLIVSARDRNARATAQLRGLLAAEAILARIGLDLPLAPHAATGTLADGASLRVEPWAEDRAAHRALDRFLLAVAVRTDATRRPPVILQTPRALAPP